MGSDVGAIACILREPVETRRTLIGTAGTWFCYDVAFYGTNVFTPAILDSICMIGTKDQDGCDQTLLQTSIQAAIVQAMGIPGIVCAILLIEKIGSKRLNVWGMVFL